MARIYCQDCCVKEICEARKQAYIDYKLEVPEPKMCPLFPIVAPTKDAIKKKIVRDS